MSCLASQSPFCLSSKLSGSLDQLCSSPSLLGLSITIWTPGVSSGQHPGHVLPSRLTLCLVYFIDSPGPNPTWVLVASRSMSLHGMIGLVPILTSISRRSTSEISKGNMLGYYRNLGSLRYGNEYCVPGRAMSCMLGCFLRNLRCGGNYIARHPSHFGGLWRAA